MLCANVIFCFRDRKSNILSINAAQERRYCLHRIVYTLTVRDSRNMTNVNASFN